MAPHGGVAVPHHGVIASSYVGHALEPWLLAATQENGWGKLRGRDRHHAKTAVSLSTQPWK